MLKKLLLISCILFFVPVAHSVKIPNSPLLIGGVLLTGSIFAAGKTVKEYNNARCNNIYSQNIELKDFLAPLVMARKCKRLIRKYQKVLPWAGLTLVTAGLGTRFLIRTCLDDLHATCHN